MPKIVRHDKLVRDKIPNVLQAKGVRYRVRVASNAEYAFYLHRKLKEEVKEFEVNPSVEELADILEVLRALAKNMRLSLAEVERVRVKKHRSRGGFQLRIVLQRTEE